MVDDEQERVLAAVVIAQYEVKEGEQPWIVQCVVGSGGGLDTVHGSMDTFIGRLQDEEEEYSDRRSI